jgi:hypothetical protein
LRTALPSLPWNPAPLYDLSAQHNTWLAPPANALWTGPTTPGNDSTVWYRYTLDLDASVVDISSFSLPIGINVDDNLYHIYVNDEDILALAPGDSEPAAHYSAGSPYYVTLDQGWKDGENQIVVVTHNTTGLSAMLIQPGSTAAPLCTRKTNAVPTLDRSAYWLTGLGILALAGFAARRRRAAR